jgi:DNA-binding IclR family transcriptional regulator
MPKRLEIDYQYLDLCRDKYPERPTHRDLATQAKISKSYARKLIIELENTGLLTDLEATNSEKRREKEKQYYLDLTEELFLLALRSESPGRPNHD